MNLEYPLQQQYGTKREIVPKELNSTVGIIYITDLAHDVRALLFRDMGLGDKLITEDVAHAYSKGLKELTARFDGEFQEILERLQPTPPAEDIF